MTPRRKMERKFFISEGGYYDEILAFLFFIDNKLFALVVR